MTATHMPVGPFVSETHTCGNVIISMQGLINIRFFSGEDTCSVSRGYVKKRWRSASHWLSAKECPLNTGILQTLHITVVFTFKRDHTYLYVYSTSLQKVTYPIFTKEVQSGCLNRHTCSSSRDTHASLRWQAIMRSLAFQDRGKWCCSQPFREGNDTLRERIQGLSEQRTNSALSSSEVPIQVSLYCSELGATNKAG